MKDRCLGGIYYHVVAVLVELEGEATLVHGAGEAIAAGVSVLMMVDVKDRKTVKEVEPSLGK